MANKPRPSNFNDLDTDAPRTQRIIQAALTVNAPWEPEQGPGGWGTRGDKRA
jgi:hypothetical protein